MSLPKISGVTRSTPYYSLDQLIASLGAELGPELAATLDSEIVSHYRGHAHEYVLSTSTGKSPVFWFGQTMDEYTVERCVVRHGYIVRGGNLADGTVIPLAEAVALLAPHLR